MFNVSLNQFDSSFQLMKRLNLKTNKLEQMNIKNPDVEWGKFWSHMS